MIMTIKAICIERNLYPKQTVVRDNKGCSCTLNKIMPQMSTCGELWKLGEEVPIRGCPRHSKLRNSSSFPKQGDKFLKW
ncbi:hypothetical protein TNCT_326551 [Trichonephila clavata]|uniref:Uncharacterized protein n=1 Tax=Trichonephila clavata TaxID=2740835 RepID=A0A8X6HXZ8_TRICU|nr:hypothetical protein TNCT_326551 [Trichonephila clavata]